MRAGGEVEREKKKHSLTWIKKNMDISFKKDIISLKILKKRKKELICSGETCPKINFRNNGERMHTS